MEVHYSSKTSQWNTPHHIVDKVVEVFGKQIDVDPCSDDSCCPNIPARFVFTESSDGLKQAWVGRVYMNPPYGREISKWISYAIKQYEIGNTSEAILLLPARTDTKWFNMLRDYPCCFIRGRLHFIGPSKTNQPCAPFPNVVVYLGDNEEKFKEVFSQIGNVYKRVN